MQKSKVKKHLLGTDIKVSEVRIINLEDNKNGIYPIKEALQLAEDLQVDLILHNDKTKPVICKLQKYDKYLYELKGKEKERKSKVKSKSVEFGIKATEHDMTYRAKNAIKFLNDGCNVEVVVTLPNGREFHMYKDKGFDKLDQFLKILNNVSDGKTIIYSGETLKKGKKFSNVIKIKK